MGAFYFSCCNMKTICAIALFSVFALTVLGKTHFSENFNDAAWTDRWVESTFKGSDAGNWVHSAGKFFLDENDKGIKTGNDARFYQLSAAFDEFSNKDEDLVFQFSIKNEQRLDCGGGYIKLLPAGVDQQNFNGDSDYNIMFGPDICGSTKRVHVIFNYKGKNYLLNKEVPCESDELSHLYTLIVNPDNTYEVKIDGESKQTGSLTEDWDMIPPKEINDPDASKPDDWVDEEEIDDPEDEKPENWDDEPETIADPDAEQPDDWDTELDGDWEAPMIPNPKYKGEWSPKKIPNPDYKGPWVHPQVANPDYFEDDKLYSYKSNKFIGIEIWQVKSGTIFDDFLITDDEATAETAADAWKTKAAAEKEAFEKAKEEERKKAEEEAKKAEEAAEAEEEDGEDDEADEEDVRDEL